MTETRRAVGGSARASQAAQGRFTARVLSYNVVDDYGTVWLPGCFADSLRTRMPRVAWAHSWVEPIGQYVRVVADSAQQGLVLEGQLDDFDAVPRARQAFAQLKSGTMSNFSVGFTRLDWRHPTPDEQKRWPGVAEVMIQALLDEASPVIVGAVPGTALLDVRSRVAQRLSPAAQAILARHSPAARARAVPASPAVRAAEQALDDALLRRRR